MIAVEFSSGAVVTVAFRGAYVGISFELSGWFFTLLNVSTCTKYFESHHTSHFSTLFSALFSDCLHAIFGSKKESFSDCKLKLPT